jgi:hypothetical protein
VLVVRAASSLPTPAGATRSRWLMDFPHGALGSRRRARGGCRRLVRCRGLRWDFGDDLRGSGTGLALG